MKMVHSANLSSKCSRSGCHQTALVLGRGTQCGARSSSNGCVASNHVRTVNDIILGCWPISLGTKIDRFSLFSFDVKRQKVTVI